MRGGSSLNQYLNTREEVEGEEVEEEEEESILSLHHHMLYRTHTLRPFLRTVL
jgi:hypothetical protein